MGERTLVEEAVAELYVFGNNNVSRACYEAYGWGYCLGTQMTWDDYIDLTRYPESVIINDIEVIENVLIEGNC